MSVYEMEINPRPAEQGAERIVKSFKSIQDAMDKLETSVSERARKLVSSFSQLSRVRGVSREAISQLQALSSALGSFRGPSKAAVDNTTRFLNFLRSLGRITLPSGAGMAAFLAAISGFKGPTATAGRNTQSLLRALSGFSRPLGATAGATRFLTALASYRGPHANAGRNTRALLDAISNFRGTPRNISAAIAAFDRLATSIGRAAAAMGTFRRAQGGNIRVPTISGGGGRGFNPRQYGNDLGFMNTMLLRTQTAFHALGGILAAREFISASNNIIKIRAQLEAATGSAAQARVQFAFLQEYAEKLGLEFVTLSKAYGFFLGSIKGTNVTFEEARTIFVGFTTAARALQLSTADTEGVFRALGQIMSKGKLQAEELRGQLGDRLPGAFVRFARALDLTKPGQLDEALKKGAISGDRLKNAIVEVARSLEVEFAAGADKMSKTVDAAFNRLKNTFTFTAAQAGANGLNAALISLMDTLRQFMESRALSAMLSAVAGMFQLLAANIEIVTYALGVLAVSSTLKWIAGMTAAQKIGAAFVTMGRTLVALTIPGFFARMTAGAWSFTGAMTALGAVIKAHPIFFIAAAIVGVAAAFYQLTGGVSENQKALETLNKKMADGQNFAEAYTLKLMDMGTQAGQTAHELWEMVRAMNAAALRASQENIGAYKNMYTPGGLITGRPSAIAGPQGRLSPEDERFLNRFVYRDTDNNIRLRGEAMPNRRGWDQQSRALSLLYQRTLDPQTGRQFEPAYQQLLGRHNAQISESQRRGYTGAPYAQWAREVAGDYNGETMIPGISGEVPEKADKSGASKAAAAARQYEQDIKRALEAFRDLRRETKAAYAEMDAYLAGGIDNIQLATARADAEKQVNNLIDSFNTPQMAERGIVELTAKMRDQVDILDQLSPAARAAREELIALIAAENTKKMQAEAAASAAKRVDELREENRLQGDLVAATAAGGEALRLQTIEMEIQRELRGVAPEQAEELEKKLREQLNRQQEINDALEYAKRLNEATLESNNMRDTMGLYTSGRRPDEIEYYKELIEYRNKLINDGYSAKRINEEVALRAAILNQKSAYDQIQKEYEESRQMAQDMADAFVDGFRRAIEEGQSFGKTLKGIFSDLKSTILNFVLYDPLRKWLTDVFTMGAQGGSASVVTSRGLSIENMAGTFLSGFTSLLGGWNTSDSQQADVFANRLSSAASGGSYMGLGGPFVSMAQGGSLSVGATGFDTVNDSLQEQNELIVTGTRATNDTLLRIPEQITGPKYFDNFKKIFDWRANSKAIGDLFKGGMADLGKNIGPALQAVGQAFAMFQTGNMLGKQIGKALGLGFRGSNVLGGVAGGAAAGFSLGGPIGAAVGAIAGGILGFMKKKPKIPSSYGSVVVGEGGFAEVGTVGKYGKTTTEAGKAAAGAAASMFNQFALSIGATLTPGNYGTFGRRKFKMPGPDQELSFYSLSGVTRKGKPIGREGVDWIKGSDSEVQAFALIQQVRRGMITGLSDTLKTVFQNTKSTTMEALQGDIQIGEAYDAFIKGSFVLPDVRRQVEDLNDAYKKLSQQAKTLGLNEARLASARDRLLKTMKDDFNWNVNQGILEITDPRMAAYNALVKEYRDAVDAAMAVGGDLAAVERLYGLKRQEILEDTFESATQTIRDQARELLTALTASDQSPLAPGTIFANARSAFGGLRNELMSGNTANVDQLSTYAQNYLGSAYDLFGSSAQYFDIFREVTDFLRQMENYSIDDDGTPGTGELPELPALQTLVDEINARNEEMTAAINGNTGATVDVGERQLGVLEDIRGLLGGTTVAPGTLSPYSHNYYNSTMTHV